MSGLKVINNEKSLSMFEQPGIFLFQKMECAMRPSFICSSLQTQETDDQDNFSIHGNIISVSGLVLF